MTVGRDLHEYSENEVRKWAKKKGLAPGRVRGTNSGIQFVTKGGADRVEVTDWDTFLSVLKKKRLAVYGTKEGWMKIMKRR